MTRLVAVPLTDIRASASSTAFGGDAALPSVLSDVGATRRCRDGTGGSGSAGCNSYEIEEYQAFVRRKHREQAAVEHVGAQQAEVESEVEEILAEPNAESSLSSSPTRSHERPRTTWPSSVEPTRDRPSSSSGEAQ
jgi:hypothetical protein